MAAGALTVLVPDAENDFALSVLRCLARAPGIRAHALSTDPWSPIRFSRCRTRFVASREPHADDDRLARFAAAVRSAGADVVVPVGQRAVRLLSRHRNASLGAAIAPVPDERAFDVAADKRLFAAFTTEMGLAAPATVSFDGGSLPHDLEDRLSPLRFPALVKPARGSYGRGIDRFDTREDLLRRLRAAPPDGPFVVQTFLSGYDIDCSVLCVDGDVIAYTVQRAFLPGYHAFGAATGVDFVHDDAVFSLARRLTAALRWSGIAHIDMRYDADDATVKLIEMNPRYWGSLLGSLAAGVNFPYLSCLAAIGSPVPPVRQRPIRYVAGRMTLQLLRNNGSAANHEASYTGDRRSSLHYVASDFAPELFASLRALVRM